MYEYEGDMLFSPSDLTRFMACQHAIFLDLKHLKEPLEKTEADEQIILFREKGNEHEEAYLQKLEEQGLSIAHLDNKGAIAKRSEETLKALQSGVDVVYQAALLKKPWHGYADFLIRVDVPSRLGEFSYEVWDTKLSKTARTSHLMQLCLYSDLLRDWQGIFPQSMGLVLGTGEEAGFRFSQYEYYYEGARTRYESYLENPPEESYPDPCSYCSLCQWKNICQEQWNKDEHLSLVANIHRTQIKKLREAGVNSVRQLSELSDDTPISKLNPEILARLRTQSRLQIHKTDTDEDRYELLHQEPGRGYERLPEPNPGDIFFDIEGDPLFPDGLEYLLGNIMFEDGSPQYHPFWAHSHDEESRSFGALMDFFSERMARFPDAHIYHYANYEEAALKRLTSTYGIRENDLDNLLRQRKFVDLLKVVREGVRISEPSYSLKNSERFYIKRRDDAVQAASESIIVYERWCQNQDPALLQDIANYNEFDCRSTYELREWLLSIRPKGTKYFDSKEKSPDENSQRKQNEAEQRRISYEKRLVEGASRRELPVRHLTSLLLEFHRREAKPKWWAMYNRQGQSAEELMEDPECLGGLVSDPDDAPYPVKSSIVFPFRFSPQDFKFGKGNRCYHSVTLEDAGEIVSLDQDQQKISLKRGVKAGPLPEALSIIPTGPIDQRVLREAIYRFADGILEKKKAYSAIRTLLDRDLPKVEGMAKGQPLIEDGKDVLVGAIDVVSRLQKSCLFIQGPPGSGKTHISAKIIVDLIRQGRKVGVASNTHKAINNLLSKVEKTAEEKGVRFRGIKKSTAGNEDSFFHGNMILDVTNNDHVDLSVDLIAGTAWLFAREDMDQALDYLFIDEAGQVSLANTVAMGLSSKNLILVGDQMQLGQPIQGVHPEKSGQSVLEYLLEDTSTIPPERGIFLPESWRMQEDVCRFISDAVYDGRLNPEEKTANQLLILNRDAHSTLRPTGIHFEAIIHTGCSQKSEEEAELVSTIYTNLLNQAYRDVDGKQHPVTPENVLIVSPYNMQVNYLKSILPVDSRVGTVDKFQGQEAEVVIVSMTTSSEEDLPRNIEFLYSKNRLNVAISRARCLAIIVASPRLLEIPCRTTEQMELVNTLCWVRDYAIKSETQKG